MIRKHSIQYILLALLAGNLAFTSCSDSMVEEKLFSQIGDGNLSDIEGARLLTNGIYGYVQYFSYFGGNNWLMNVSSYSDEFSVIGVVRLKPDGEAHKTSSIWMPDMLCRKQTGIVSTVLLRNVMR